ncbi:hypothetical protein IVB55_05705 [Bradyrhizobium sp. CW4]|uniref:hypothetical protein n=1 Tax=Bradyrhizobium sp. CW4 TaxID=2782687 RepID=UPI001FF7AE19|nr:hypothetical protein [Bradyrhizobium sp. CW4]MCK1412524.1 hypothetical protein [Bradyrhizobium sp. CW4]
MQIETEVVVLALADDKRRQQLRFVGVVLTLAHKRKRCLRYVFPALKLLEQERSAKGQSPAALLPRIEYPQEGFARAIKSSARIADQKDVVFRFGKIRRTAVRHNTPRPPSQKRLVFLIIRRGRIGLQLIEIDLEQALLELILNLTIEAWRPLKISIETKCKNHELPPMASRTQYVRRSFGHKRSDNSICRCETDPTDLHYPSLRQENLRFFNSNGLQVSDCSKAPEGGLADVD